MDLEAELRIALEEGLVSRDEAEALVDEARRRGCGLLELLAGRRRGAETETFDGPSPTPTRERPGSVPGFPVPGWERYQPLRFLGQGGMGQVFLAYDPRLRREVALKFVVRSAPELVRRLLSEASAQARVDHERVCKVYEVGEAQGHPFISMQYVRGVPLQELASGLTVEQKALVMREVCEGVHAAHRAGLIHRDIKPSNILVERAEDGRLKPYVMDFGLARDWKEGLTATGSVLGTPHYMAPEQARGEVSRLDRRADVYSLGATLYQLLTGQAPIPGSNALEVLANVGTVEPRPPRALDRDIPVDLEAIVLKCLEKERGARYGSARELAEDLERFLSGEPVRARPSSLGYRLRKRLRKHRVLASVVAVALVLTCAALGQAVYVRQEAARREHLARRFTEQVERIEALARYSSLSRLHDIREDREQLRGNLEALAAEVREAGATAVGPGHYALGRGYLALKEEARAREALETAWREGYREPRVAWALAVVVGHLYRDALLEVERLPAAAERESRRQSLARDYREPALSWLRASEGAEVPSTDYVAALLAFYEDRLDEALVRLEAAGRRAWFHEASLLRGDILQTRAARRWNTGDQDGARADLEAGRRAYADAAATAESVPEVHYALASLELTAMVMELYGRGDVLPPYTRGLEALARALAADPGFARAKVSEAIFHNRLAEYRMNRGEEVESPLEKAMTAAREALSFRPEPLRARLALGYGLWLRARALQARGLDPSEPLREAIAALEGVPEKARDYELHATLGLVFRTQVNHAQATGADPLPACTRAIQSYRESIRLDARIPDAWLNLGMTCLDCATVPGAQDAARDLEEARVALEKARALNPGNFVTYFLGGRLHEELAARRVRQGGDGRPDLEAALDLYQRGIAINAKVPQLHHGVSLVLLELAREAWDRGADPFPILDRAQAACEQAIAVAPKQGYGQNNLGEVRTLRALYRWMLGQDPKADALAAERALSDALVLLPGMALPWANLARVHHLRAVLALEQGQDPAPALARAEAALREAFTRNPEELQAWLAQGRVLEVRARTFTSRGRRELAGAAFEEAARAFEKTLQQEPGQQEAQLAFGQFCRERALWMRASGQDPRPWLEQGLEVADALLVARPGWADALLLRASLLSTETRPPLEQARKDLDAALARNPHLKRVATRLLGRP
ncbi:serine/threonine protein kinase [Pyxidicoccus fallax]|uniref:Serine/threonine protein kinase n=1 Tax=Pyxidicoccus fallax TaxID=394095 RepID=A0A848LTZ2_9BACT|nr:serine/threonine-protein kinase [Pyxidicoccus fallax]NMO21072.1 serine/threonine protein kinase [Pyxidicoccus fallax]NPC84367.1 serine/threonine protein kinase [Pyxidicoccus fallax]